MTRIQALEKIVEQLEERMDAQSLIIVNHLLPRVQELEKRHELNHALKDEFRALRRSIVKLRTCKQLSDSE